MADEGGVLDDLRAAILAGEFVAGQRLVEVDLCERFGCGRFFFNLARAECRFGCCLHFRGWLMQLRHT